MDPVYLGNCNTFGDALNKIKFEIHVPEYYEADLPNFYRKPLPKDPPVLNGELVSWDEYQEHCASFEAKPKAEIPSLIYNPEDNNIAYTKQTVAEMLDMFVNKVPFDILRIRDIEYIVLLIRGYLEEMSPYFNQNARLDSFVSKLRQMLNHFDTIYQDSIVRLFNRHPELRRPKSISDILKCLAK